MRLVPWLRPTLVAPCLVITILVALGTALGWVEPGQSRLAGFATGMAYGGVLATVCVAVMLVVDFVLFRARLRRLPEGRRAWLLGAATPLVAIVVYQLVAPADELGWFGALVLPVVVIVLVTRFAFSLPFDEA
ncbi:MAG TPA: hypothetical protein VHB21_27570, partial [Minicystis sp.]|nr:hypothetical protein [Minicystis sp.]